MVERLSIHFKADNKKIVLLPFSISSDRAKKVIKRVNSLSEKEVSISLKEIYSNFSKRHKYFKRIILSNYSLIENFIVDSSVLSKKRKLLLGAYFSKEYSIEAASLFNPSIVEYPDQDGIPKGSKRLVMSLRATGEGHISSIEFRELVIDKNCDIKLKNISRFSVLPGIQNYPINSILDKRGLSSVDVKDIHDLIESNYRCSFPKETPISERVIFPHSKSEMAGMEDVRFVKFIDNGRITYYGTYTAYNGKTFRVQLITTNDFANFDIETINGPAIRDKGLALFPEKIDNKYSMIGRIDGENLYLLQSKNLYNWPLAELIRQPENKWEFMQIGNCGSPLKTNVGWILITHAVGPLRRYVISALLLDLKNPSKIIGSLEDPLIEPTKNEREGYVPNVVYSCGSIIHNNQIIIPYAMSDSYCGFARIKVEELLRKFK
jgi:predicted GH43/DUF377 family glycosyl hydrolase